MTDLRELDLDLSCNKLKSDAIVGLGDAIADLKNINVLRMNINSNYLINEAIKELSNGISTAETIEELSLDCS